ncbi:MAG TPA: hypothetical protein VG317_14720 [Pseudonocardiaceae bacterium]|nr:hypothetical protein [Pseudonocardiaceae bacterium]
MTSAPQRGYQLAPQELTAQVKTLATIGDQTSALVASAGRLAQRTPMLGTAPPAIHLAMRLREAAGESGLTGEVSAANTELAGFHQALQTALTRYLDSETDIAGTFRTLGGESR